MSGLYIPELGHLAMILALCFAIVQAIVPLLLTVLGFYCFFGAVLLLRMRLEVLKREARSSWVKAEVLKALEGAR